MKRNFLTISAIFLSLTLSLSSCSSDDDGGSNGNAASGTVTAKIDGANFQSAEMLSTATSVDAGPTSTMTLQGTDMQGKGFNFVINGYEGQGSYEIGGSNSVFVVANYVEGSATNPLDTQTWTAPFDNESVRGSISFSEISDDNVKGTFEFTAKNPNDGTTVEVTEGAFDLDVTSF